MKCHNRYQAKWPLFTLINKSHVFPFLHFFIPYFFSQNKAKSSADLHFLASRFPARGTCSSLIIIPNDIINEGTLNINDINIEQKLQIEILGTRIKYRNEKIQVVGKII